MLQSLPRLRFNKEGNLLAVTTADNGFKIIANAAGLRALRAVETSGFEALRSPIESAAIKVALISFVSCYYSSEKHMHSELFRNVCPLDRCLVLPVLQVLVQ